MSRRNVGRAMTLLAAAVCLIGARPAGPDPWEVEVARALAEARARLGGPRGTGGATQFGVLVEGGSAEFVVPLREGVAYYIVAVCDHDCAQLGLEVSDPRRYTLDSDRSDTPRPSLRIVPQVSGAHRVVVTMGRCAVDPCRYGVAVVAR